MESFFFLIIGKKIMMSYRIIYTLHDLYVESSDNNHTYFVLDIENIIHQLI